MTRALLLICAGSLSACAATGPIGSTDTQSMMAVESAFAATMADRDFLAFASFIADDSVFVSGGKPLRGKAAILEQWRQYFDGPTAPFSWKPELAALSDRGRLGYTEGPVSTPDGKVVARFFTTWRLTSSGRWQVAFDNGYAVCDCRP